VRLLAIADLHLAHRDNRAALQHVGHYPDDWLIVAGDIGERPDHLRLALDALAPRFARVIWSPGNHDLWRSSAPGTTAGQDRYDELVAICRSYGTLTPEDPYATWPAAGAPTFVVPMFLLFDYSFRPPHVPAGEAVAWARAGGVVSMDESRLDPSPFPSRADWCAARCAGTEARLAALPAGAETILINHWPLRYDLARPPRIPRFSLWCGTTRTHDWPTRFRARAVISGHLHLRTTIWRDEVRFEEVSLGYPRDWRRERGLDWYLRDVLSSDSSYYVPLRDPFRLPGAAGL
jgi:3',5'-cyclic AMP phosphodiesterase CpdA